MKKYISIILLSLLVTACGDLEFKYFTRINSDGTVFKSVTARGDSSNVYDHPFSFDVEDGWALEYGLEIENEGTDSVFFVIASQTFTSIEESNLAMYQKEDVKLRQNIQCDYSKRFRWFFTFHEYSESFLQRFPYHHLNIEDFLSEKERDFFFSGDTTMIQDMSKLERKRFEDEAEKRWFNFIISSIRIEYMALLNSYTEEIAGVVIDSSLEKKLIPVFSSSIDDGPDVREIALITDSIQSSTWVSKAYNEGYFARFENEIEERMILISSSDYTAEIEVPGLIYRSNAQEINEQTLKWQFEGDVFQYSDFTMFVHYRTTNLWAFIITIFVIALFIWYAFVKYRK